MKQNIKLKKFARLEQFRIRSTLSIFNKPPKTTCIEHFICGYFVFQNIFNKNSTFFPHSIYLFNSTQKNFFPFHHKVVDLMAQMRKRGEVAEKVLTPQLLPYVVCVLRERRSKVFSVLLHKASYNVILHERLSEASGQGQRT